MRFDDLDPPSGRVAPLPAPPALIATAPGRRRRRRRCSRGPPAESTPAVGVARRRLTPASGSPRQRRDGQRCGHGFRRILTRVGHAQPPRLLAVFRNTSRRIAAPRGRRRAGHRHRRLGRLSRQRCRPGLPTIQARLRSRATAPSLRGRGLSGTGGDRVTLAPARTRVPHPRRSRPACGAGPAQAQACDGPDPAAGAREDAEQELARPERAAGVRALSRATPATFTRRRGSPD